MSKGLFRERLRTGGSRLGTLGSRPKSFYCTVFGQMDRKQTNLAVNLRTYFYPKEELHGNLVRIYSLYVLMASLYIFYLKLSNQINISYYTKDFMFLTS